MITVSNLIADTEAEGVSVSFVVVSFNQQAFIREAVRSALAQTYEPLEIIIADDCSRDGTVDIIRDEIANYDGPHRLVLLIADQNTGLAGNLNAAFARATGKFVVVQGGDDISALDRTAKVVAAFQGPTPVDMVCSTVIQIDDQGEVIANQRSDAPMHPLSLAEAAVAGSVGALGCACAYSRELWTKYGPLDLRILQEDTVLPFRALLEGGARILDEPLVKYRIHGTNLYAAGSTMLQPREKKVRWARSWLAIMEDWNRSCRTRDLGDRRVEADLRYHLKRRLYEARCYDVTRLGALGLAVGALLSGLRPRHVAGMVKRHVFRRPTLGTTW